MLDRLLLFGATGDLASRLLIPAVGALYEHDRISRRFRITGAAPRDLDDEGFRKLVEESLATHAPHLSRDTRRSILARCTYRKVDFNSGDLDEEVSRAVGDAGTPAAAYLALPPSLFAAGMDALASAGLTGRDGSRIVVEKPFGTSQADARTLNALAARIEEKSGVPGTIYRVDHVRGMPTVQNFVAMRFGTRLLDAVWNGSHIEHVEILWEETLALEGRAGFYDRTGALRDVLQNHMLQLLALVAMEPPASSHVRDFAEARAAALRAARPPSSDEMAANTRRARYTAGRLPADSGSSSTQVPDYAREEGVDADRGTETFAEVVLSIDTPRWSGTRFVLRAGKALRRRRKEIVVRFRAVTDSPFRRPELRNAGVLRIGIDGPTDIALQLAGEPMDAARESLPVTLSGSPPPSVLPAYAHVLLDVLSGGNAYAVHGSEAEQAWRIVTPILDAWSGGQVPLEEYPAGSDGPAPLVAAARCAA